MLNGVNILTIFLTGLLTGGLTCIAVQGGLMAATLSQDKKHPGSNTSLVPLILFLSTRIIVYSGLGFILGFLGSFVGISIQTRIILQFLVVIFMLGTAFNLLNLHPFFEVFMIAPPRFLTDIVYKDRQDKQSLSAARRFFAPILLGFLTVFIPCGATQAMMALAVSNASPFEGALILFIFILGTTPLFIILGFLAVKMSLLLKKDFLKIAAIALIFLALFNLDSTLALSNSPVTLRSMLQRGYCLVGYCFDNFNQLNPVTEQTITFTQNGYTPNIFAVSKGSRVTLHLVNQNATGCIQAFTISALNIQKIVLPNQSSDISFVAPDKPGRIAFTCSSGLYPGTIEVI